MSTKKPWPYRTLSENVERAVGRAMFASGPEAFAAVMGELSAIFSPVPPRRFESEAARATLERIRVLIANEPGETVVQRAERLSLGQQDVLKTALLSLFIYIEQETGRDNALVPRN